MTWPPRRLLGPRYWFAWLAVGCLAVLTLAPYHMQTRIGRRLGRLWLRLASRSRHVAETNLRICFPCLTAAERSELVKTHFEACGIALLETTVGWWTSDGKLPSSFAIHGIEHVYDSLSKGKGVILCSAHFLSMELAGRFLAMEIPFAVVYQTQKHPMLEWMSTRCRGQHYHQLIPADDLRGILAALRANQMVWYTADVDPGRKRKGVFAPFFGCAAYSTTAVSRLARLSGAQVLPGFPYRRHNGSGYDLIIDAPLKNFPTGNVAEDVARLNLIIESAVRRAPQQYLWQYKRFKTRPPGETKMYEPYA